MIVLVYFIEWKPSILEFFFSQENTFRMKNKFSKKSKQKIFFSKEIVYVLLILWSLDCHLFLRIYLIGWKGFLLSIWTIDIYYEKPIWNKEVLKKKKVFYVHIIGYNFQLIDILDFSILFDLLAIWFLNIKVLFYFTKYYDSYQIEE